MQTLRTISRLGLITGVAVLLTSPHASAQTGPPTNHDRSNMAPSAATAGRLAPEATGDQVVWAPVSVEALVAASGSRGRDAPQGVSRHAFRIATELYLGTFETADGDAVPDPVERRMFGTLVRSGSEEADPLVPVLLSRDNRGAEPQAERLAESLWGLFTTDGRLRRAVSAYNAFVDASGTRFLADPPAEFLVIRTVLGRLLAEAAGAPASGQEPQS